MDAPFSAEILLRSEEEATAFGTRLAPLLNPGDTVLLKGPIGAGKTHLARAIIQARLAETGAYDEVPSPTYTLVQVYPDGDTEIWHADLFRLTSSQEVQELGLEEAFETAIVLIEWPDRLGQNLPDGALEIELTTQGDTRRVRLTSDSAKWSRIVPSLDSVP